MGIITSHESRPAGSAIGIDLGTTFSCVGVSRDGKVEIVASSQGYRKIPSVVAFTNKEYLPGVAARNKAETNPTNTVYEVKRLIGRRFSDATVQGNVMRWPFKVINSNGKPKVEVNWCGKTKQFTAEEILAMVLLEMKKTAEAYLGEEVTNAVITVPACFNGSQRKATIDAGKIAGLNVMRIISEPMAAALAYGLDKRIDSQRNVLVFDLGGGTFDVSVISIENEKFEVKAVGGDTNLGGGDFDSRLVDYCVETFKQEHGGIDLTTNAIAISRLRKVCENAKRTLSLLESTSIDVDSLYEDIDFSVSISRHDFEQMCSDLFDKMLAIVDKALRDAKLDKADVHETLLVGGSTRVLKVQQLLQDVFSRSKFIKSINLDEAAAYGSALLASDMTNKQSLNILEVAPISLHLANPGGVVTTLIEHNTIIPMKKAAIPITCLDNQEDILLRLYGSGHALTNDYNLVGEFYLLGIPSSSRGSIRIEFSYAIDENGILNASVTNKSAWWYKNVQMKEVGRLSKEEIEQMINESEKLKQGNEEQRSKMAARNKLESYIFTIQSKIKDDEIWQKTSEEQRKSALEMCASVLKWVETDQVATREVYDEMLIKVERICSPIMAAKKDGS
ncbi:unnamed protein product [Taenia asiatica]|uniref:Heat shock protein 70 n=1 Tax=Taenia asiatica TaxID=60517 RepID=A0A0R3WDB1_TAEAS|nr:unnamed protein product [Taenia asiatica]